MAPRLGSDDDHDVLARRTGDIVAEGPRAVAHVVPLVVKGVGTVSCCASRREEPRSGSGEEVYGRLESWADEGEVPRTPVQLDPDLWRVIQQMDGSLKAHSGSSIADACCGVMVLACNTCGHRNQMIYDFGDSSGAHSKEGCS